MPENRKTQYDKRVQPRKRHVARSEQKRPQEVAEARQDRQRVQEDHRHAVHREQLVVLFRRQQGLVRSCELQPDDQRLDAADQEEHEGRDEVTFADRLVVDGAEPAEQSGLCLPDVPERLFLGGARRHPADDRNANTRVGELRHDASRVSQTRLRCNAKRPRLAAARVSVGKRRADPFIRRSRDTRWIDTRSRLLAFDATAARPCGWPCGRCGRFGVETQFDFIADSRGSGDAHSAVAASAADLPGDATQFPTSVCRSNSCFRRGRGRHTGAASSRRTRMADVRRSLRGIHRDRT